MVASVKLPINVGAGIVIDFLHAESTIGQSFTHGLGELAVRGAVHHANADRSVGHVLRFAAAVLDRARRRVAVIRLAGRSLHFAEAENVEIEQ